MFRNRMYIFQVTMMILYEYTRKYPRIPPYEIRGTHSTVRYVP